nr:hypothetical protein [Angustibacter aerolatus]
MRSWRLLVARVNTSTSTPRWASRRAVSTTYTFRPPASPVPGCSRGEVWTASIATRCGSPTSGHRLALLAHVVQGRPGGRPRTPTPPSAAPGPAEMRPAVHRGTRR